MYQSYLHNSLLTQKNLYIIHKTIRQKTSEFDSDVFHAMVVPLLHNDLYPLKFICQKVQ